MAAALNNIQSNEQLTNQRGHRVRAKEKQWQEVWSLWKKQTEEESKG